MNITSAHTLFGFDRLAKGGHRGNSGIGTGSTPRKSARTHLFNTATGRTACGSAQRTMTVSNIPADLTEANWAHRITLCQTCRAAVGA